MPPAASGQRALAAIVFTDVVGFSARMQTQEERTLGLLQRDFETLRATAASHAGTVLKTLGDGLLLHFPSAVQAVSCALAAQRGFAARALTLPAGDVLTHRIGIHLGDVFMTGQDVMGDGVNIASRLQAVAEPGGICISQTVYDVVKNKLALEVVSLGPRELKNIAEAMPVYRILLAAHERIAVPATAVAASAPRPRQRAVRPLVLVTAGLVLVLGAGAFWWIMRAEPEPAVEAAESGDVLAGGLGDLQSFLSTAHTQYLATYDFAGFARYAHEQLEGPAAAKVANAPLLLRGADNLIALKTWLVGALRRHGKTQPLQVTPFEGDPPAAGFAVYASADRQVHIVRGETDQAVEFTAVPPGTMGRIIVSALHEATRPGREVLGGAHAFATLYNLPAMTTALGRTARKGRATP